MDTNDVVAVAVENTLVAQTYGNRPNKLYGRIPGSEHPDQSSGVKQRYRGEKNISVDMGDSAGLLWIWVAVLASVITSMVVEKRDPSSFRDVELA